MRLLPWAAAGDHLEWAWDWPWTGRLLVLLLALAILGLSAVNLRSLASVRKRSVLLGLRALALLSLLGILAQPTWISEAVRPGTRRLAVLVDRSQSMATGPEGQRRWDVALQAAKALVEGGTVSLYGIGERLEAVGSVAELSRLGPTAKRTDFLGAVQELAQARRPGLGGVVVISDGLDNAALRARNPSPGSPLDADSVQAVEKLQAPIHGVFVADKTPPRDVAVAGIRCSSFGFTRTYMPVAVELELSGYEQSGGSVHLVLSDNGKPMVTQPVALAGPSRRTVELEFQPLHVGTHVIEASVAPLPDEATEANNKAWVGLRVVRDRTRVLHLAGHPSWDTRFLRTHLRGDPSVDLVSFYVMVGQGSGAYVSAEDTTLIPFPTREIFEESLASFDLVVLQDFPFGPFQLEQYLPQMRQYVTGGGAFLVIGGKQSLSAGGYYGTALADWLPVRLEPLAGDDTGYAEAPVSLRLTPAGAAHPVTLLAPDADANAAFWGRHTFLGRNTGLQAAEGGSVLVTDPSGRPVLAVGEVGDGRSAVLATDSLWTWAFPPVAGEGSREPTRAAYHRLLDQMSAWLLRDPDLDLLRVEAPGEPVPADQPVTLRISARTAAGAPVKGVLGRWAVVPLANQPERPVDPTTPWPTATDVRGETMVQPTGLPPGAHIAVVEAEIDGREQRATAPLIVAPAVAEFSQLQPTDRLLQALARASGGKVWRDQAPAAGVPMPVRDPADVGERVHTELWSHPGVLLWMTLLLAGEWLLRRRWGLA